MKHIQNNQKFYRKTYTSLSILKNYRDFCQMFVISKKENHTLRYVFKNL
jgi:hypothetical protein